MGKDMASGAGSKLVNWFLFGMVLASLAITSFRIYSERSVSAMTVPATTGLICDRVWRATRTGEPSVGWYRACVRYAAEVARKGPDHD